MPTKITHQSPAALRATCLLGPQDEPASIPARHFAYARLKSLRGQQMNHAALAHLPKHTALRAETPRPSGRTLHLISDRTGQPPQVAAILCARMLAGQRSTDMGGAA